MTTEPQFEERHASWLELFFDLVAVAGIAALAHLLASEPGAGGLFLYVVAFVAFWLLWACFTTYSSIAAGETRTVTMLVGMAALGVMTAAVPEIEGDHAGAFALAYVVGRFVAGQPYARGTVVVDLPVVHAGAGTVPWIASLWAHGETRYLLWALGLALDLVFLLITSGDRLVKATQERLEHARAKRGRSQSSATRDAADQPGRGGRELPTDVSVAAADVPHLGERMSLFVLIVLGEALVQTIHGASEAAWDRRLFVTWIGAFLLIISLWQLTVRRGSAGVALLPVGSLTSRHAWLCHLVATAAIAALSAVLATLVEDPDAPVSDHDRVLMATGVAVYAAVSVVVHLAIGLRRTGPERRAWTARAATVGVPVLLSCAVVALSPDLAAHRLVWVLVAGLLVATVIDLRREHRSS